MNLKNSLNFYYLARWLYLHKIPFLPSILQSLLFLFFKAIVPYRANIGKNCKLAHGGIGVVLHPNVSIGNNVLICQQVTIGGAGKKKIVPIIGNDVYIGAGAKVLGPSCVVAGVPAKILRKGVNAHDVEDW
jgi:serine O-acetyltransferase